ncbi:MAG: hypothetical protein JSS10_06480 [Verrucomicrobia bacterium]|nr:hypothetical protein [Verrucomicrobiota bacterium]
MRKILLFIVSMASLFSEVYGDSSEDWVPYIQDKSAFTSLSKLDDTPGAMGIRSLKFLMKGVDTENLEIYFINTNKFQYHFDFADKVLKIGISLKEFNQKTYFTDNRTFLAGTILAYENFTPPNGQKGVYLFEFWPTDPVKVQFINKAFQAIAAGMKFAAGQAFYHPAGETHMELWSVEKDEYDRLQIPVLTSEALFENLSFSPLNLGEGYGYLRVAQATSAGTYTIRDVVIFKSIPNELSHVAGVITEEPQTPLSHINLKAKQNSTPNAFLRGASSRPDIASLIDKPVYYKVTANEVELRLATAQEIEENLEKIRPKQGQVPVRDLTITKITSLDEVRNQHASVYGAKAANIGELRTFLTEDCLVPEGFAIPFYFYDLFMTETGLYAYAKDMIQDEEFQQSPEKRAKELKKLQKKIKKAEMPAVLQEALDQMWAKFPEGTTLRCRSSTNNEDLPGFNGAGLYDSFTHHLDEGNISKSIQQVFASLWNFRAFEEREFYRIDHFQTAMGVLIHPNFEDELSNGVAITKNPYDPHWDGCYINVQLGDSLVTNPDPGATPEELLVMKTAISVDELGYEIIYIRHSSHLENGKTVLSHEQAKLLALKLEEIQKHFKKVYDGKEGFAMDVEFKFDKEGRLVIKQARPWVE